MPTANQIVANRLRFIKHCIYRRRRIMFHKTEDPTGPDANLTTRLFADTLIQDQWRSGARATVRQLLRAQLSPQRAKAGRGLRLPTPVFCPRSSHNPNNPRPLPHPRLRSITSCQPPFRPQPNRRLPGPNGPQSSVSAASASPRPRVEDTRFWNQTRPERNHRCRTKFANSRILPYQGFP